MKNLIIALVICTTLFSCKNTKQLVKSNTEVHTSTEQVTTKTQDEKADTKTVKTVDEKITETDSTIIEETIVELSKPDSTGQQHPEKITTRVISKGKNKQTVIEAKEEFNNVIENKIVETEKKNEEQAISNETDTKTVKKSQSWKVIALIVLVLAAIVYVVLKKKGEVIKTAFNGLINSVLKK